jgi:hypothetical protein
MATALSEIGRTFWSVWCFRRSFDVEEGSWFDTLLSAHAGEHTSVTIESVAALGMGHRLDPGSAAQRFTISNRVLLNPLSKPERM